MHRHPPQAHHLRSDQEARATHETLLQLLAYIVQVALARARFPSRDHLAHNSVLLRAGNQFLQLGELHLPEFSLCDLGVALNQLN